MAGKEHSDSIHWNNDSANDSWHQNPVSLLIKRHALTSWLSTAAHSPKVRLYGAEEQEGFYGQRLYDGLIEGRCTKASSERCILTTLLWGRIPGLRCDNRTTSSQGFNPHRDACVSTRHERQAPVQNRPTIQPQESTRNVPISWLLQRRSFPDEGSCPSLFRHTGGETNLVRGLEQGNESG